MLEIIGTIYTIGEIEGVDTKFTTRAFVIKYLNLQGKEYPVKFYLNFQNVSLIDNFRIGQKVKVVFELYGNEYVNKNTGETNIFEKKIALAITDKIEDKTKKGSNSAKNTGFVINSNKYQGPNLSRSFDDFPSELVY